MIDRIVIYVHGIWMPGYEMAYVRHRLAKQHALRGKLFSYPSVSGTVEENVRRLAQFILAQNAGRVDLVGHSLGGVLALRTLLQHPDLPPGRVVCMGSPLCGSRAAAVLSARAWGSFLIGETLRPVVVERAARDWAAKVTDDREVGSIAGTRAVGMGRVIAHFDEASDGTVAVSETMLPGVADHLCMRTTHTGMIFSSEVAGQVAAFLQSGLFSRREGESEY